MTLTNLKQLLATALLIPTLLLGNAALAKSEPLSGPAPDFALPLGVFDFSGPGRRLAVKSLHPGRTLEEVQDNTGFDVHAPPTIPQSRGPTKAEAAWLEGKL